jgi:hypothetical protein
MAVVTYKGLEMMEGIGEPVRDRSRKKHRKLLITLK